MTRTVPPIQLSVDALTSISSAMARSRRAGCAAR
jgi:hypothetical protein